MNINRLKKVRDLIAEHPGGLCMQEWHSCIAGYATNCARYDEDYVVPKNTSDDVTPLWIATHYLELTTNQAYDLFVKHWQVEYNCQLIGKYYAIRHGITPVEVLAYLDYLIEQGNVEPAPVEEPTVVEPKYPTWRERTASIQTTWEDEPLAPHEVALCSTV